MESVRTMKERSNLSVAALRALVIDETNKAKSGHPGMALDIAPAMYALFRDHLVATPNHPDWVNRDRFVLSSGHVSSLYYAMLHIAGYDVTMDDLKSFRQLHSRTPGHPEVGVTSGVDASSGPLGQGIGQAVGMAIAEKTISASYKEGSRIMNHYTYCICGDGCLEEGISQEAISIAGHNRLNKLILIYDENGSTLDGPTSDSLSENVKLRFLSSEWNVLEVNDGNSIQSISQAISKAKRSKCFPTLIIVHTKIGYGSKNEGSHVTHGEPLGVEDGNNAKKKFGYDYPEFSVPNEVYEDLKSTFVARGEAAYKAYAEEFASYKKFHEEDAKMFLTSFGNKFASLANNIKPIEYKETEASRATSGRCLTSFYKSVPFLFGGSADVAGSTKTNIKGVEMFTNANPDGHDMHWGIREFGMASCCNGIALHGGLKPYCACFMVFADYLKPAIRMAALQHLNVVYIFTHDSIAVGEDGPTHQPIEQLAMLRSIPNIKVIRPADQKEVMGAYKEAFLSDFDGPVCLILSRQSLPLLASSDENKVKEGGYFISKNKNNDCLLIATGSEVSLAIDAASILKERGIVADIISAPCLEALYKNKEMMDKIEAYPYEKRISIEMLSTFGWGKLAKHNIGIDNFGASGKPADVLSNFGFTKEAIAEKVALLLLKK